MHPTERAIARYHELLAAGDAAGEWRALSAAQAEQGLYFGERALCQVLRPHFVHPQDWTVITEATRQVVSALHTLYRHLRSRSAGSRSSGSPL